ncbi:Glutamine dumper 3 [Heracleum sosnowskyi]|uniref:Glutamine dumper 3 n=1 Tax=Heracleum sosnowskyi TaxID=360622 RepID=A0AAD8IVI6_9APIA|nr:Glutamine dumper 3 [Heracleum sosnowskyi]
MAGVGNAPLSMQGKSPWHSPVPYLFGGLAAMLGLIAFALLILACSYWKLSSRLDNGDESPESDIEAGDIPAGNVKETQVVYVEKCLVIMAGQEKPTYLATPMWSRATSFDSNSSGSTDTAPSSCS